MNTLLSSDQVIALSIRRHLLWLAGFVFLLLGGIGVWVSIAEIVGAVIASGSIVVESHSKQVQHQEGGIVKQILVRNGDLVQAGDLLIQLDDTVTRASLALVVRQLIELNAQQDRLQAELVNQPVIAFTQQNWGEKHQTLLVSIQQNQTELMQARRKSLQGREGQLNEQIRQFEQQIVGLQAQRDAKQKEMRLVNDELKRYETLYKKKMVAVSMHSELRQNSAELAGEYGAFIAEIAQAKEAISERKMQILQIQEDALVEILQQLQDARLNIAKLEEQKIAAEDQLTRIEIRAPRSGYVHNLTIHTLGGVIQPAETLMLIVPREDLLLVEALIAPVDIDKLSLNQDATIRLPSFDQRTTPELSAKLKLIAADLLQDQTTGMQYYQARLEIPDSELAKLNGKVLIPGMPVEVFVKTENRTILSYLMKPITDQVAHALREA